MSVKEITIKIDDEAMTINSVEGTDSILPIDIAKVLLSVALTSLNKIGIKKEEKIIKPKIQIIGGNNGKS